MGVPGYFKRALAEMSGQQPPQSTQLSLRQGVLAAMMLGVFALGFVGWLVGAGDPSAKELSGSCAFRVAEADAPAPVTEGDAMHINTCVRLERLTSPSRIQLGLSNRASLAWDKGMLFDFGQPDRHCMWMKDMHFSLDMIWLNEQNEIVALREKISPDTYPNSFCGPGTARYVVEVNAGIVRAGDLRLGQHLNL